MITQKRTTSSVGASSSSSETTRALLTCGVVAGPVYILVGVIEMLTRPGFDLRRHALSLLSNGEWGWVHIAMLVTTGLLTIAGAVGMRRVLRGGRGGTWGPLLVGLYGLGVVGAGFFVADPALGFPLGTPEDANTISWHGMMHFMSGGIGFLGLIAACCVFAYRFATLKQRGWAAYSLATGVIFFAAFFGIATGSQHQGAMLAFVILAFSVAIVLGWAWVSAMAARLVSKRSIAMQATFTTTIVKDDVKNATGLRVPPEAIAALGTSKRPKVVVSLNGYSYRTTVAVMGGEFMMPLNAEHREAAGVQGGDQVEVTITLDVEPRTVEVPEDLVAALAAQPGATAAFEALAYSVRKEHVRQVESAKAQETRDRRVAGIVAKLAVIE